MTRINCVPPEELTSQHLLAEYRELPRVFGLVRKAKDLSGPECYCLGPGHVRFFYTRCGYLLERQKALIAELRKRGFKPTHTDPSGLVEGLPPEAMGSWEPDDLDLALNRMRLKARMPHS